MGLDLSGWDLGGNLELPSTIDAGMPEFSIGDGMPSVPLDVPRSEGFTFSGILGGLEKTAQSGFELFSKVYQLQDAVEGAKFNRAMTQQRTQLAQAQTAGTLDIQKLRLDSDIQLAKLQAQAALANEQAKVQSSIRASTSGGSGGSMGALLPFLMVGGIVWAIAKGAK